MCSSGGPRCFCHFNHIQGQKRPKKVNLCLERTFFYFPPELLNVQLCSKWLVDSSVLM